MLSFGQRFLFTFLPVWAVAFPLFCSPVTLPPESTAKVSRAFVAVDGPRFVVGGKPFRFVGANLAVMDKDEDRQRLAETLRAAALDGVKVVRVWAHGEGGENAEVISSEGIFG